MKISGLTTMEIKKINKSNVYQCIYNSPAISKQQIASSLLMGLTTVTQNLKLLEEEGLIERKGFLESTGGRKANAIRIVPDFRISVGIEILKDRIYITAVNLYGKTIAWETYLAPFSSAKAYCKNLGDKLHAFLRTHKIAEKVVLGVSIALQGIISSDGTFVSYGKILNHTSLKLRDFQEFIPYPCRLVHDSKAAAALEIWHKKEFQDSVILLLNENLGSAVVLQGVIHHGLHSHSGTLEHLCADPEGPLCYCGKHGCLETYCSAGSLQNACQTTLEDFFKDVRQKKPEAVSLWLNYLQHLASALRNLTVILDVPVILSGYLSPYLLEEDIDVLYDFLEASCPFSFRRDFIHISSHGFLAPAIGAALNDIDSFLASV